MSTFNQAYQCMSSTGQKLVKRPRVLVPVALATIALLGASYLWISKYENVFSYGNSLPAFSYSSDQVDGIPPTRDLHMTEEQCTNAFPLLYQEADRARIYFGKRGGISKEGVDAAEEEGHARVVIMNNTVSITFNSPCLELTNISQMFVKAFRGGINSRTNAALAIVYRTLLSSTEALPDVE